ARAVGPAARLGGGPPQHVPRAAALRRAPAAAGQRLPRPRRALSLAAGRAGAAPARGGMTAAPARGRYQGMEQILRYNLPMYVGAAAAAVVAAAGARWLPVAPPVSAALLAFAAAVVLGSASSLLVSHYVYDRSELFRWDWLFVRVPAPASWTVVHAGLDEVSPALRERFPGARGDVLDIYDPRQMTEPAIARARRSTPPPEPARAASAGALPAAAGPSGPR